LCAFLESRTRDAIRARAAAYRSSLGVRGVVEPHRLAVFVGCVGMKCFMHSGEGDAQIITIHARGAVVTSQIDLFYVC
jgi:hypothetical protein